MKIDVQGMGEAVIMKRRGGYTVPVYKKIGRASCRERV